MDGGWLNWDNCTLLDRLKHSILSFVCNLHFNMYSNILYYLIQSLCKYAVKIYWKSFELDLHTLQGCYVQCSYLMSLLLPVKHPKLWGMLCNVLCTLHGMRKYCQNYNFIFCTLYMTMFYIIIEEVFNIVKIERLIFVLCTRQWGSILVEYLILFFLYLSIWQTCCTGLWWEPLLIFVVWPFWTYVLLCVLDIVS